MPGKSLFIAGIEALDVQDDLGRGDRFGDMFFLTNNVEVISALLPPSFLSSAGSLETSSLLSGRPVAYLVEQFHPEDDSTALEHLTLRLKQLGLFLHLLWYTKDNAAHTELGYLLTGLDTHELSIHRKGSVVTTQPPASSSMRIP